MVSRVTQSLHRYFQGFSHLPLQGKVSRIALPALVIVGFGLGITLAYRLFCCLSSPGKSPDDGIAPLKLSDEQHGKATPKNIDISIYQLDLHEIFPRTIPHSYIHALGPTDVAGKNSFTQAVIEKAGLIITIGTAGQFAFLGTGALAQKQGPDLDSGCMSTELYLRNGSSNKQLWHLHIDSFFKGHSVDLVTIHQTLLIIDEFIADRGINLTDKSLMVSSTFPSDSALFILYHQLYHQLEKLVEKESKDQSDEEIANRVLQDTEMRVLLDDRLRLIKKLLPGLVVETHGPQEYRDLVLMPMIQRMRTGPNAPAPAISPSVPLPSASKGASPALSAEQKIEKKLEMLAGLNQLQSVDPDQDWDQWEQFILQMNQCFEQLIPLCSNSYIDSHLKIWEFICKTVPLATCQNFYKAMLKRTENDQGCRLYRDFTSRKLREQGYLVNLVHKEGRTFVGFYPAGLLKALKAWYEQRQPDKAPKLQRFIEELERQMSIKNPDFESLLTPLGVLEYGAANSEQFELLKALIAGYEKEPKIAVKDYLKKVLTATPDTYTISALIRSSENRQDFFVLLGECLTTADRAYKWLEVLYKEQIEKYGAEQVPWNSFDGLDPALYSRVKDSLILILSKEAFLDAIIRGNEGRVALACMWLQIDEEILLQAAGLLFKARTPLDQFLLKSALSNIWKSFASNPTRIANHAEICDRMLEVAFKIWFSHLERKPQRERQIMLESSEWQALQANDKLPLFRAAYRAAL